MNHQQQHLHHQAADTCIIKQQTPASLNSRHLHVPFQLNRSCSSQSTSDNTLGLSSALRGHIDITSVNQGLNKPEHQSSSFSNRSVHIFDRLQLRLRPNHATTPTICIKHRDYPDLLDALSPKTKTAESTPFFCTDFQHRWDYTDIIQQPRFYTHAHLSCKIRSIKTWLFKLTHLSLPFV